MKWFKHQSSARNDERLARLEDKAGLEGYGFYFKMLEIVAEIIDESDRHEVTYSLSRWGRQVNITSKKFVFLAQCCADVGLMIVQRCDNDYTVKIPNLLKYRDNHTKNLQVTSKQEREVEVEKEVEEETTKPSNTTVLLVAGGDVPKCPHQEIIALYRQILPQCHGVRDWTAAREKALATRWKENKEHQSLAYWEALFKYIASCPFLVGKVSKPGATPFLVSLDWICKAENFTKIREGRYEAAA
jgi:hypothetical protein